MFLGFFIICILLFEASCFAAVHKKTDKVYIAKNPQSIVYHGTKKQKDYVIVVEKEIQQLTLYLSGGTVKKIARFKCSTGKVTGAKNKSGDKKTPEGVYFFTKKFKNKYISDIYGIMAFPTDYPNIFDKNCGKNGNAIWLHGTNKVLKNFDSNGCIVLEDKNIFKIASYIELNRTPIILIDRISYKESEQIKRSRREITAFISKWSKSLETGTYHEFLDRYSDKYAPEIYWWNRWMKLRAGLKSEYSSFGFTTRIISISAYKDIFVVLADQILTAKGKSVEIGRKKIYLSFKNGIYKIEGDEFLTTFHKNKLIQKEKPVNISAVMLKQNIEAEAEIVKLIGKWSRSWSSKNIVKYKSCYSDNFFSKGKNLNAWIKYKKKLNIRYGKINVAVKKIVVENSYNKATARFIQIYRRNAYKEVGRKRLVFNYENGKWKIVEENWSKL